MRGLCRRSFCRLLLLLVLEQGGFQSRSQGIRADRHVLRLDRSINMRCAVATFAALVDRMIVPPPPPPTSALPAAGALSWSKLGGCSAEFFAALETTAADNLAPSVLVSDTRP